VDATLSDGSRLLAMLPPVAPAGPAVVIERPARRAATLIDLAARGVFTTAAATLLGHALAARRNVLVTGPRGSGRSTLVAALVASLPASERVVVVEERREVGKARPEVTSIDPRSDWKRGLELAQRLRPQRLVVGEANEAVAAALVGTLATGVEGWIAVAEGASPLLATHRFASLAAAAGPLTREEALARIAATRPLVVHLGRLGDGTCRLVALGEVRAGEGGGLHIDDVFVLRIERVDAQGRIQAVLNSTGVVPSFAEVL
jgi:pilus assembly protein CpaF